jgi:peptidoglycan-N-acetylglucosamine deacetylase
MVIWFIAAVALVTVPELLIIRAATSLNSDWFGKALRRLPAGTNGVALTFDDGPSVPYTGQILDALGERNIKATFFVCGANVERYPDVARRIVREGHAIGNHTYSHPYLYLLGQKRLAEEIDRTQAAIEKITGVRPRLFRPPYGIRWFGLDQILRERELQMVLWSGAGYDWKNSRDEIVTSTIKALEAGTVVLLHDGHAVKFGEQVKRADTVAALPAILEHAASKGLSYSVLGGSES